MKAGLIMPRVNSSLASPEILAPVYDESCYYGTAYRDYDKQNLSFKIAYYARLIGDAVTGIERPRILNIGCAMGFVLRRLPKTWTRVGVDASAYAIGQARAALPDATFVNDAMPPDGDQFDLITAFDVTEHVVEYRAMIANIDRILAPGGRIMFVGPVVRVLDCDVTHYNKCSRHAWLDLVSETFDVECWTGIFRYLTPAGYLHFGTEVLRGCATAILLVAKKRRASEAQTTD